MDCEPVERSKRWWDAWHQRDFTWEGLIKQPWWGMVINDATGEVQLFDALANNAQSFWSRNDTADLPSGFRVASLQDYWRGEEDVLVSSPDGTKRYTRLHLPPTWDDGSLTEKLDWTALTLKEFIRPVMAQKSETGRYQLILDGAVVMALPPEVREEPASFSHTAFLNHADFSKIHFGARVSFVDALFAKGVNFESCVFADSLTLRRAVSLSDVDLSSVNFQEKVYANDLWVCGALDMDNATFHSTCDFESSEIAHASCQRARFRRKASFDSAKFIQASFDKCSFEQDAVFLITTFERVATFEYTVFMGKARFEGAHSTGEISFDHATFQGPASFEGMTFASTDCEFSASYKHCAFNRSVNFGGSSFDPMFAFCEDMFYGSIFNGHLNIRQSNLPFHAFNQALIAQHVDFDDARLIEDSKEAASEVLEGLKVEAKATIEDAKEWMAPENVPTEGGLLYVRLRRLEGGTRSLRVALEKVGDARRAGLIRQLENSYSELAAKFVPPGSSPSTGIIISD